MFFFEFKREKETFYNSRFIERTTSNTAHYENNSICFFQSQIQKKSSLLTYLENMSK